VDADATETNHSDTADISCGKLWRSPPFNITGRPSSMDSRSSPGVDRYPQSAHSAGLLLCQRTAWDLLRVSNKQAQKTRDPPGGTAGRVKPYGRWGGWALAPNTASMGRNRRSHRIRSRRGRRAFNPACDFFRFNGRKSLCSRPALLPKHRSFPLLLGAVASKSMVEGPVLAPIHRQRKQDDFATEIRAKPNGTPHGSRMPEARG
jgi:hypothetical protein